MYIISWRKKRAFFLEENWLCDEIEENDLLYLHASHYLLFSAFDFFMCVFMLVVLNLIYLMFIFHYYFHSSWYDSLE